MQQQVRGITSSFLQVVAADVLCLEDSPEDWAQLRRVARLVRPHARRFAEASRGDVSRVLDRGAAALAAEPRAREVFLRFACNVMAARDSG
jgi:hypothetical protein